MSRSGEKRSVPRLRPTYFFGYSPIRAVRVSGHSMSPTLNWGDWVLFRRFQADFRVPVKSRSVDAQEVRVEKLQVESQENYRKRLERSLKRIEKQLSQKIVLIARRGPDGQRDLMQIKRVVRVEFESSGEIGIWVEGDNAGQSSDSRHWGYVKPEEVIGIYVTRYHLG